MAIQNISSSVGIGGNNKPEDVLVVQKLLNQHINSTTKMIVLSEDGLFSTALGNSIIAFQLAMKMKSPDGKVDPGGQTIKKLNESPEAFRIDGRLINTALPDEGSSENLARRKKINDIAIGYDKDTRWAHAVKKDDFGAGTYKCNKFVYDVLVEADAADDSK